MKNIKLKIYILIIFSINNTYMFKLLLFINFYYNLYLKLNNF